MGDERRGFPNLLRYKFSKESEPELLEFLKVVKKVNYKGSQTHLNQIWEMFLPMVSL